MSAANSAEPAKLAKKIHSATSGMSRSERRIARVLHATNFKAGLESVASLANRSNVSGPTVIRFTAKLGYVAYRAFQDAAKVQLNERIESPADLYHRTLLRQRKTSMDTVSKSLMECIGSTLDLIDPKEFEKIVRILGNERRSICAIGGQASGVFADMLAARLYLIRPGARSIHAKPFGYSQENELPFLGHRDVIVAFDFRRYQESTILFAKTAALQGSTVILVTDTWLSPIADFAHHVLTINPVGHMPYDCLTPCLALVEVLLAMVLSSMDPKVAGKRIELCEQHNAGLLGSGDIPHSEL